MLEALVILGFLAEAVFVTVFVLFMKPDPENADKPTFNLLRILLILSPMAVVFFTGADASGGYRWWMLGALLFACTGDILLYPDTRPEEPGIIAFMAFQALVSTALLRVTRGEGFSWALYGVICAAILLTLFLIQKFAPSKDGAKQSLLTTIFSAAYILTLSMPIALGFGFAAARKCGEGSWIPAAAAGTFLLGDVLLAVNRMKPFRQFTLLNSLFYYIPLMLYAAFPVLSSVLR